MKSAVISPHCKELSSILVVIPAIAAHRPIVEISFPRLKKRFKHASFLIVSPTPEIFNHLADEQTRVEPDKAFSAVSKIELEGMLSPDKRQKTSWYFQQLLKFSIVAQASNERVLIVDADTILIREIEIAPGVFFTSKERHRPYFEHFNALFHAEPPFKSSAITNFMWFSPIALRQMLLEIEYLHQESWWTAIITIANSILNDGAFSEYETYANWYALRHGPHQEMAIHIFRRGDLLVNGTVTHLDAVRATQLAGYSAIAFELHHSRTIMRHLGAWMILRLGLKIW
jgi:hypothetical protein